MIKVSDLTFSRNRNALFEKFDISIPATGASLLSGANGSGKTTLLNLISGILVPDSGSITINGLDILAMKAADQAKLRSVAPQRRIFDLAFRVDELLRIIKTKALASHSEAVIRELDIQELLPRKITELSLGQQQRVSVALALIQSADYYLLDEPFSAQDSEYSERLLSLLSELKVNKGILVISHNSEVIRPYFDSTFSLS